MPWICQQSHSQCNREPEYKWLKYNRNVCICHLKVQGRQSKANMAPLFYTVLKIPGSFCLVPSCMASHLQINSLFMMAPDLIITPTCQPVEKRKSKMDIQSKLILGNDSGSCYMAHPLTSHCPKIREIWPHLSAKRARSTFEKLCVPMHSIKN